MAVINKRHEIEKLIKNDPDLVIKYIIDNIDYIVENTDGIGLEVLAETLKKKGIEG
jgi:hypothetical protein